jgi:predicted nucleotidyltransferase
MAIAAQEISVDVTRLLNRLASLCKEHYGERLISLVVFGSVGRGTARPDSDIDLLLVVRDLPIGRMARVREFSLIETALDIKGHLELSPVFKTPEEVADGSPLLLDMVEDARVLFDREDFFQRAMENLKGRLHRLNARRVWQGNAWYWDLKPDYKQGEVFEI